MSKAAIGIGLTGIGATTAVAVPVSLSSGSGSVNPGENIGEQLPVTTVKNPFTVPNWDRKTPLLSSANDIQDKYKETDCLKTHFDNIDWSTNNVESWDTLEKVRFYSNSSQSCLIVEHHSQQYESGKWWNEFRLVWSLKGNQNNYGFITVVNVTTENGKLMGDATFYFLKKQSDNWSVVNKKEKTRTDIKSTEELGKLIPKTSKTQVGFKEQEDKWGFNPDFSKICGSDDCQKPKDDGTKYSNTWNFNENKKTGYKLNSWCDNLHDWFKDTFGWEGLEPTIESSSGEWEKG